MMKIGKERDNGKPKERDRLCPRYRGRGSERERHRTEYRENLEFAALTWFCLGCKLVAVETIKACECILCDLWFISKLFRISCQHLNVRISFKICISGIS